MKINYEQMKVLTMKAFLALSVATILQYILDVKEFLIFMWILVLFEFITSFGIAIYRGDKDLTEQLWQLILRLTLYPILILVLNGMEQVFSLPIDLVYFGAFIVCLYEAKRLILNIDFILKTNFWVKIEQVFDKLKKAKDDVIDDTIKEKKKGK